MDPHLLLDHGRNLMEKQLFVYLFRLRSTSCDLVATTTKDVISIDVEDGEGMTKDGELAIAIQCHTRLEHKDKRRAWKLR
jgi:hypothetical protein